MIKNFVFDFDGTIANSKDKIIQIINELSYKYGYEKLSIQQIKLFQSKGARWLISNLEISKMRVPFLMRDIRADLFEITKDLKPFVGISNVLRELKDHKIVLGILTTNSESNVRLFIKNNNIDFFDFIYHGSSLFGKDVLLRKMLKGQKLNKEETVYVGDEDRDIEAAKKIGLKSIAVTWGFNSKKLLASTKPNYLITKPLDLLSILESSL